jgi:UDP:flavonoid glycosyltransferase YjiC (YdhE family)
VATILFVSELGGGAGHARRLLPLARAVDERGHHSRVLVPNPRELAAMLEVAGHRLGRTPRLAAPSTKAGVATSFADILGAAGFDDCDALEAVLRQWDRTLQSLAPALIVCEFSPFLCLATYGGSVPVVVLGHGFVLPPAHLPRFPGLLADRPPLYQEDDLLRTVQRAQRRRGRPPPGTLPAILAGTMRFLTGLSELDPYQADRRDPVVAPPFPLLEPVAGDEPDDVFAYLSGRHPTTPRLLDALARSGLRGSVYVRSAPADLRAAVAGSAIEWLDRPTPMTEKLARVRAVVHHGSMLTTEEALLAGRPQVVAPIYLEHLLTTRALLDLGVAATLFGCSDAEMVDILRRTVTSRALEDSARSFAAVHQRPVGVSPWQSLRDTVLGLAAG